MAKRINPKRRNLFLFILLIITAVLSAGALLLPIAADDNSVTYELGDVVSQDILAPETLSFTSPVMTEIERQNAEDGRSECQLYPFVLPIALEPFE